MDSFARLREMVHEMTGVPEEQITPESHCGSAAPGLPGYDGAGAFRGRGV